MQLYSCKRWSEVGGNLAREKQLLSLAWSEVGGGLGSRLKAGGDVCRGVVVAVADTGEGRKRKWWC